MPEARRSTDDAAHAHKRNEDEFARLHRRIDDHDGLLTELIKSRFEHVKLHNETTASITALTEAVRKLTEGTEGLREVEDDVRGMMRLLGRMNCFISVIWRPMIFCGVVGGMAYLWIKEKLP